MLALIPPIFYSPGTKARNRFSILLGIRMIRPLTLASLISAAALSLAAPAQALTINAGGPLCSASATTTSQAGYVACLGSFDGNIDNQLNGAGGVFAAIAAAPSAGFGFSTNQYFNSGNYAVSGNPFATDAGALDNGVIKFDNAQTGKFVLGIKQGNDFSLYLFDGSAVVGGISQLSIDSNGVKAGGGMVISHAGFFGTPTAAVPEPETYALMLAGLAAVGFVSRRRKSA